MPFRTFNTSMGLIMRDTNLDLTCTLCSQRILCLEANPIDTPRLQARTFSSHLHGFSRNECIWTGIATAFGQNLFVLGDVKNLDGYRVTIGTGDSDNPHRNKGMVRRPQLDGRGYCSVAAWAGHSGASEWRREALANPSSSLSNPPCRTTR